MSTDTERPPRMSSRFPDLIRHDLPASLVVFLVSLPLSIGIAVAAGAPVAAGLIAAVVGGTVAGLFGRSTLQVSGPTASLTVVVAEAINQFGWAATCFITMLAGGLQILFGLSRIARGALAIAPVVVHAMLAGIGVVIALQQAHVLMGGTSLSSSWDSITGLPHQLASVHPGDLFIGLLVIAILVGWRRIPAAVRRIPAPLVAVVVATGLTYVLPVSVEHITLNGTLLDELRFPQLPHGGWATVALLAVTIALIASVETLLSAVAVDRLRRENATRRTDLDRELIGQGAANMISGLIGGLPVAAVIVRSITNVKAGARTRASTMLHGLWILLFSVALVEVVRQIPKAALAGLLIVVGIQLIKLAHIRRARRSGDLLVYAATVFVVVFGNLLLGMLVGLALAFALLLWRVVRVSVTAEPVAGRGWLVSVDGSFTFLALPKLTAELAKVPPGADVTLELTVDFLDHAAYDAIQEWTQQHRQDGGTVEFVEMGAARMADAADGRPVRGPSRHMLNEALSPWRRTAHTDPVVAGVAAYHRGHKHVMRPHMDVLRHGQEPDSLFVTCADSRIVPNVITSSGPGDLFTVRNIGNLIPAGRKDSSIEAALIYALDKLDVRSVVVCGHSGCGAMEALHSELVTGSDLDHWLAHARPSLDRFRRGHPVAEAAAAAGFGTVDQLGMVNVAVQLETLSAHPVVRRGVRERGVVLSGLFFDIATARVVEVTVDGIAEIDDIGVPADCGQPIAALPA